MMKKATNPLVFSIDKDIGLLSDLMKILTRNNYSVMMANEARKAISILDSVDPDIILLDEQIAEMDSYEFCSQLQNKFAMVPVVFLNERNHPPNRAKAFAVGAVDFLSKPINDSILLSTLAKHLKTKKRWRRLPQKDVLRGSSAQNPNFAKFKKFLCSRSALQTKHINRLYDSNTCEIYSLAVDMGIADIDMARYIADFLQLPYIENLRLEQVRLDILPASFCITNYIIPINIDSNSFVVSDPFNLELIDFIKKIKHNEKYRLLITEPQNILDLLKYKKDQQAQVEKVSTADIEKQLSDHYQLDEELHLSEDTKEDSQPMIIFINRVIENAYQQRASDIHIEPWENKVVIRFRIDGHLQKMHHLSPGSLIRPLVARIKIMSDLNIAERRLPQDGRIVFKNFIRNDFDFDLRVSTIPANYGEKVVMRILDKQKSILALNQLGFSQSNIELYHRMIHKLYGMVLHVGPTGSGKSMTLYAAINELDTSTLNIQTAENPIEYTLPGVTQLQINEKIGLTFQRALKSFLRQDPDVILVGEIRDGETAQIAVQAALTGHMLFSTLHTNDAASTIIRFIDMGIPPYLVSSSVQIICAQRLMRCLCDNCKSISHLTKEQKQLLNLPDIQIPVYKAIGCHRCNHIGYYRRTGIHELLVPNDEIRRLMNRKNITIESIKKTAVNNYGMTTLYWDAIGKMLKGLFSVEDVLARVHKDDFDYRPPWIDELVNESPHE